MDISISEKGTAQRVLITSLMLIVEMDANSVRHLKHKEEEQVEEKRGIMRVYRS